MTLTQLSNNYFYYYNTSNSNTWRYLIWDDAKQSWKLVGKFEKETKLKEQQEYDELFI